MISTFRPPQFSEEVEWLPAWLQPPTIREGSNKGSQCPLSQGLEEMQCLQQSISNREYGDLSDDGRYMTCHLFLSGEENSPMNFPSSCSNNVFQHHLHLSLNGESETSFSPVLDKSKAERYEFKQALLVQQLDAEVIPKEKDIRKVDCNADEVYIVPIHQNENCGVSGHQSLSLKEDKEARPEVDTRPHSVVIDNDAVELAVAASEALIIHDVVNNELNRELWTASAVLEAAIKVKEARFEDLEEAPDCSLEESSDVDFLSDLDESTMGDAYGDVGLTLTGDSDLRGCDSVMSYVKDSYATQSYMSHAKQKCNDPENLEVDSASISTKQQSEEAKIADVMLRDVVLESLEDGKHKEHVGHTVRCMENAGLAHDIDPMLSCSAGKADSFTKKAVSQEGLGIGNMRSSQTIVRPFPLPRHSGSVHDTINLVPDRFQSRWFGGWAWKKVESVPALNDHSIARSIPGLFVGETSYLSESADIASDKNSCVQKQDKECKIVSQSSVAAEVTHTKANDSGNLLSEDVGISRTMSSMEPLCSVVPCSISLPSACDDNVPQNLKQHVNTEKHSSPRAEADINNLERASPDGTEFLHGERKSVSKTDGESTPTIRRQVGSLKNYSMLSKCDAYMGKESTLRGSLPMNCDLDLVPVTDLKDETNNQNNMTRGEMQLPMRKEISLPTTEYCGNVSRCLSLDIGREENPEQTVVPESNVELLPTKFFGKVVSNCKTSIIPRRKRVHFSEAETTLPHGKKCPMPQSRDRDPSVITTTCKRVKISNRKPQGRAYEVVRCSMRRDVKDKKMLLQNLCFLLTGFSVKKEKQIEGLIIKSGGVILDDIPSPPTSRGKRFSRFKHQLLPLILCPKRLLTTKFLYGCAINSSILKVQWLFDSIDRGSILPPKKYIILKENARQNSAAIGKPVRCTSFIFDNVAIMLHGKPSFCTKMAKVIKHGGGLVFKTLHWLIRSLNSGKVSVGAIVTEDENNISRQLKQCALEQKICVMPVDWIISSLYAGKVLPSPEDVHFSTSLPSKLSENPVPSELSEEI